MTDNFLQYLVYAREIWRKRWLVLMTTSAVCAVGWPVVHKLPDKYEVSTEVNVDTQTVLKPLLKGLAVDGDFTQATAQIVQRTLLTRSNLEKIVRIADLDLEVKNPGELESVILNLARQIDISIPTTKSTQNRDQQSQTIYRISYIDNAPLRAKKVVDGLLNLFIETILSETRKDSELSQGFLNKEISEYEAKLETAENRLKEFKRDNVGLMPATGGNYFNRLDAETNQLNIARLALDEATRKKSVIQNQIKDIVDTQGSYAVAPGGEILNPLDERIKTMQTRLDGLLLQYTEEHPDVVSVRRILTELLKKKQEEQTNKTQSSGVTKLFNNSPVYQELRISLGQAEAEIAALTARVNMYSINVSQLKQQIDTMPRVEAELSKLNRDYGVIHEHYLELVKRREAAELSFGASDTPEDVQFKVINPPRLPLGPVWPNRPLFISGVLGAGLALGIGLVILMMQLRPTYKDWSGLKNNTALPVLGAVSMILTQKEISKDRTSLIVFGLSTLVLLVVYLSLVAMQLLHVDVKDML